MRRFLGALSAAAVLTIGTISTQAYCIKKGTDEDTCIQSCEDSTCSSTQCRCANPNRPSVGAYLETPHPGLFLEQVGGRLVVNAVLPDSPARTAGILPGDEVISVNGRRFSLGCGHSDAWGDGGRVSKLTLKRGTKEWTAVIRLVPVRTLLERAWLSTDRQLTPAAARAVRDRSKLYGLYLFGVLVAVQQERLTVLDVLRGSPADLAGFQVGDKILLVNGRREHSPLRLVKPLTRPAEVELVVARGDYQYHARLRAVGVTRILRRAAAEGRQHPAVPSALSAGS